MRYLHFLLIVLFASTAYSRTIYVGQFETYTRIEDAVEAATPGSKIIVMPHPNGEPYKEVKLVIDKPYLIIQAANPNQPIVLDGAGVNYSGAGSTPRAIVQFNYEGSGSTLDGFVLRNAHNDTHNAAGVRISQACSVTITRCVIHDNDMGIMSDGVFVPQRANPTPPPDINTSDKKTQILYTLPGPICSKQLITYCRITDNGSEEEPGYNHNLYLGGDSVTIQYSEIARAKTGHNIKCRVRRVTISHCSIHDAANREMDFVDGKGFTEGPGIAEIVNCSIKKDPLCKGNRSCIHFGKDGDYPHPGLLILKNNFIETPFSSPVIEMTDGNGVILNDNVFSDAGSGAPATLVKKHGKRNVKQSGNKIPDKWTIENE